MSAVLPHLEITPLRPHCLAEDAVWIGPVSSSNSLLAWISTDRNWPHKTPSRMPIFRVLSHRCCDAKWYADNPIALRLLAHQLCDSGHFRDPRGEKRLR